MYFRNTCQGMTKVLRQGNKTRYYDKIVNDRPSHIFAPLTHRGEVLRSINCFERMSENTWIAILVRICKDTWMAVSVKICDHIRMAVFVRICEDMWMAVLVRIFGW